MLVLDDVGFSHTTRGPHYVFDLTAEGGEVVAIMGPSGSGKSTLLDLIAGFLVPARGRIEWNGTSLVPLPPEQRPCAILFQRDNVFGHITAVQNVALGLPSVLRKSNEGKGLVTNALARVGLAGIENQRTDSMSGGQQQRVAIARVLLQERAILLLDEPFTGLDDATRHDMLPLIAELASAQNRCVLMVTHDGDDAERIATRRVSLEQGRLADG